MIRAGLWFPHRHCSPKIQQPHYGRACVSELLQIDGCDHRWFEERGPACTLLVIGRTPLMLAKQTGNILSFLFIAGACYLLPEMRNGALGLMRSCLIIAGMLLFLIFQQSALSYVAWLMISQVLLLQMRKLGIGISVFAIWVTTFMISTSLPYMISQIGIGNTFMLFALCRTAGVVFVALFPLKPKGNDFKGEK